MARTLERIRQLGATCAALRAAGYTVENGLPGTARGALLWRINDSLLYAPESGEIAPVGEAPVPHALMDEVRAIDAAHWSRPPPSPPISVEPARSFRSASELASPEDRLAVVTYSDGSVGFDIHTEFGGPIISDNEFEQRASINITLNDAHRLIDWLIETLPREADYVGPSTADVEIDHDSEAGLTKSLDLGLPSRGD